MLDAQYWPLGFIGHQTFLRKHKLFLWMPIPGSAVPPCGCLTFWQRHGGKTKNWFEGMTLCTCSVITLAACRVAAGRRLVVVKLCTYIKRFNEQDTAGGWRAACLCNGG